MSGLYPNPDPGIVILYRERPRRFATKEICFWSIETQDDKHTPIPFGYDKMKFHMVEFPVVWVKKTDAIRALDNNHDATRGCKTATEWKATFENAWKLEDEKERAEQEKDQKRLDDCLKKLRGELA